MVTTLATGRVGADGFVAARDRSQPGRFGGLEGLDHAVDVGQGPVGPIQGLAGRARRHQIAAGPDRRRRVRALPAMPGRGLPTATSTTPSTVAQRHSQEMAGDALASRPATWGSGACRLRSPTSMSNCSARTYVSSRSSKAPVRISCSPMRSPVLGCSASALSSCSSVTSPARPGGCRGGCPPGVAGCPLGYAGLRSRGRSASTCSPCRARWAGAGAAPLRAGAGSGLASRLGLGSRIAGGDWAVRSPGSPLLPEAPVASQAGSGTAVRLRDRPLGRSDSPASTCRRSRTAGVLVSSQHHCADS